MPSSARDGQPLGESEGKQKWPGGLITAGGCPEDCLLKGLTSVANLRSLEMVQKLLSAFLERLE